MILFFAFVGIAALFAGAYWYDQRREAEMLARMEKLRDCPEAVAGMVDGLISQRKRETEMMERLRDHRGGRL